jgi:hypothetical protein
MCSSYNNIIRHVSKSAEFQKIRYIRRSLRFFQKRIFANDDHFFFFFFFFLTLDASPLYLYFPCILLPAITFNSFILIIYINVNPKRVLFYLNLKKKKKPSNTHKNEKRKFSFFPPPPPFCLCIKKWRPQPCHHWWQRSMVISKHRFI